MTSTPASLADETVVHCHVGSVPPSCEKKGGGPEQLALQLTVSCARPCTPSRHPVPPSPTPTGPPAPCTGAAAPRRAEPPPARRTRPGRRPDPAPSPAEGGRAGGGEAGGEGSLTGRGEGSRGASGAACWTTGCAPPAARSRRAWSSAWPGRSRTTPASRPRRRPPAWPCGGASTRRTCGPAWRACRGGTWLWRPGAPGWPTGSSTPSPSWTRRWTPPPRPVRVGGACFLRRAGHAGQVSWQCMLTLRRCQQRRVGPQAPP